MDDTTELAGAGDRQPAAPRGQPPSWIILVSAVLVGFGVFGRRRPASIPANRDGAPRLEKQDRHIEPPAQISSRSWQDLLLRVWHGIAADRILLVAAGVAFYAILALFPGIGAIISIYGLFADPSHIVAQFDSLSGVAPAGAVDVLREELTRLAHQGRAALGFGFAVSLVIGLWSANAGMSALFQALAAVYEEKGRRNLIRYYAMTLGFTAGTIVLVLLSLVILIALPLVLDHILAPGATAVALKIIRWPILLVLVALALAVIYRPCSGRSRWRWITGGSAFAAVAWLAASALFSWYVTHFGSYNRTYGSLGAIIGFMSWMWVSIIVVLVGAKLDAELERRTTDTRASGMR
jgi:membrane protein